MASVNATTVRITAEQVEEQVLQFYGSGGGLMGATAPGSGGASTSDRDTWLTTAQYSPSAWQFAFELMNLTKNQEVQFYGANTIGMDMLRICLNFSLNYFGCHIFSNQSIPSFPRGTAYRILLPQATPLTTP